ncbi:CTF8 Chromosome transmission fidelity protein 8 [Candida maltosa Xu316]|uniref:Chromosome transmission fidelity protein 8 n=1 Tax=Candida maltosa (strain Xu316) TaxID=1245528 RepID=M3JVJ7_CANMX|nr:hypothetical protein G210_3341 [Candida maltosa Xu316]
MPSIKIDTSLSKEILTSPSPNLFFTPYGLTLLEIQGELNLPTEYPKGTPQTNEDHEYLSNFITVDDIHHAVKFGNLVFDEKDESKVTLFIGKSQRLLGDIVKLNTPLAVLRVPVNRHDEGEEDVKLVDIVKAKLIFKQRPLPIM